MIVPTEPIGSIPRPLALIQALASTDGMDPALDPLYDEAIRDTIVRFEATGSPVITEGEQKKYHNFWTYSVQGLSNSTANGFKTPFSAGHVRRMPQFTAGPFRYRRYADSYLEVALKYAHRPVKQAVISPSALSLTYPADEIPGYPREQFLDDLLREHETEVRNCLEKGAFKVQIDFTEGRLAVKIDPSGHLLSSFVGQGSEFILRLPLTPDDVPSLKSIALPGPQKRVTASPRRRILIVDDNRDAAETLAKLLQMVGNDVRTAHDGKHAVEVAADYLPEVVFLDIGLPGLDGFEVCRHLRRQSQIPQPFIAAMTGYGQEEDRLRSAAAGFNAHLVKPVYLGAIEDLLARSELMSHSGQDETGATAP